VKGINLRIHELREAIIKDINASSLPIGITSLVVADCLHTLQDAEINIIAVEKQAYDNELKKEGAAENVKEICEA
jgi:hypothetical protein